MEAKPLITNGWLRALLFAICYLILIILSTMIVDKLIKNIGSGKNETGVSPDLAGEFMLIRVSFSLLISLTLAYFFRRVIDKQDIISLGLVLKNNLSHAAAGFALGLLLLGAGTFVLVGNHNLQWTGININAADFLTGFAIMIIIAFSEELVFRGYILNNLMQSMNKWFALICSALIFALFHLSNPGVNFVPIINVFLAGMLLGINYIYTKNLCFGILFHFSWNFYQGSVLGYKVSGVPLKSIFEQELIGHYLLTGGPFGFEGSVISGVLILMAIALLVRVYEAKYKV